MARNIKLARALRRTATDAERVLWSRLRDDGLGWPFRRQHPVPPYVADFACLSLRVIVEADGGQHEAPRDAPRQAALEAAGWRVLRFWNHEILGNIDGVLAAIQAVCTARTPPPRPSPAPRERE